MERPPLPSLRDFVGEQYAGRWREEARGDWAYVVFYRPFAAVLAWGLAHTSATPMAVTLAGGLSIPVMLALAFLLPGETAVPLIGLAGWVGGLLDCADGDLARLTGRTSWLGRYVDFQVDMVRWAVLFVAVGIAADRADAGGAWFAVAAVAAWTRLFARAARDYRFGTLGRDPKPSGPAGPVSAAKQAERFVTGLDGLLPIFLGLGWMAGLGGWVLMLPLGLGVLDAVATQIANLKRYARE
ncbi:MAG: CDP-alcohol phosphatidyltransferase family protein [Siculibacillus sp.]|nr:CDP-alcohol phosphatidyltransferase family protein [Siculibacillus sp.]